MAAALPLVWPFGAEQALAWCCCSALVAFGSTNHAAAHDLQKDIPAHSTSNATDTSS